MPWLAQPLHRAAAEALPEAEALPPDLEMVDAGQAGKHRLGLIFRLHFAIDGVSQGGQQREISKPDAPGVIQKGLIPIRLIPGVHNHQGRKEPITAPQSTLLDDAREAAGSLMKGMTADDPKNPP